jgi:hypothetical protein
MAVFNYEHRISYYPVPKVACSSLKLLFFRLENGFDFRNFRVNGQWNYIHSILPTEPFDVVKALDKENHFRVAVVRDPVDRFISCYRNRVCFHGDLDEGQLSPAAIAAGLVPRPSLSTFVDKLETYCEHVWQINHHCAPMVTYIGKDPSWYSYITNLQNIGSLVAKIQEIVGNDMSLDLPWEQTDGPKLTRKELTPAELRKIERFYAEDYDIYGHFF